MRGIEVWQDLGILGRKIKDPSQIAVVSRDVKLVTSRPT